MEVLQAWTGVRSKELVVPALVVHLNIVFYAASYWSTQPVLPWLSEKLGADVVLFGYLQTLFSFVQLVGGPMIGRVSDSYGPKTAMFISQAGTALSFLLLGLASNVTLLFLSRLPSVTMHTMHAAQAFLSDFTDQEQRALGLGRLSLSYGIGMVIGGPLGGFLGQAIGYSATAVAISLLLAGMVAVNWAVLPGGRAGLVADRKEKPKESGGLGLRHIRDILRIPAIRDIVVFQLCLGIGYSVYTSFSSVVAKESFGMSAQETGNLSGIAAVIGVLTNVFAVGLITKSLGDLKSLQTACILLCGSFATYAVASTQSQLYALLVPMAIGSTLVYTLNTSVISKLVQPEDSATAIGFGHATRSLCGIVGPTIGGWLYQQHGISGIGGFAASSVLVALLWLTWSSSAAAQSSQTKAE
eukprot:m.213269 g.213269  ORF g.213269 m.213269 type:complete len:413 (+) comp18603_c1_seq1:240-1478(+)